jgi:hypothetical protein
VIDERVALPAVVRQSLVEPFLLEHDAIVNARDVVAIDRRTAQHRAVIGFLPARERRQEVVANRLHVEFVKLPSFGRRNESEQPIAHNLYLRTAIEVVVARADLNPGLLVGLPAAAFILVEQVVRSDQVLVDRVS